MLSELCVQLSRGHGGEHHQCSEPEACELRVVIRVQLFRGHGGASTGNMRLCARTEVHLTSRIRKREDVALSTLALKGEGIKVGFVSSSWVSLESLLSYAPTVGVTLQTVRPFCSLLF